MNILNHLNRMTYFSARTVMVIYKKKKIRMIKNYLSHMFVGWETPRITPLKKWETYERVYSSGKTYTFLGNVTKQLFKLLYNSLTWFYETTYTKLDGLLIHFNLKKHYGITFQNKDLYCVW